MVPFKLADIGEGIAEVEVLEWFVKEGDRVQQFDRICEVQSDKATVEITSKFDGVITKLHWPKGAMAKVGAPLVDIDRDGDAHDDARSHSSSSHGASAAAPAGASKSTPASAAAAPKQQQSAASNTPPAPQQQQEQRKERHEIFATPAVRRIAREQNIDLALVRGTGRDGRILKEDMLNFDAKAAAAAAASAAPPTASAASSVAVGSDAEWTVPLRGVAKAMVHIQAKYPSLSFVRPNEKPSLTSTIQVKSMTAAGVVPHLGYCDEVQMDNLMAVRSRLKPLSYTRKVFVSLPLLMFIHHIRPV